jgi:hypothetical protein
LPEGEFKVRLLSCNASYALTAKCSWVSLVQYDKASSLVGSNSRVRWNAQAGEDISLVLNNFDSEGVFSGTSRGKSRTRAQVHQDFPLLIST